MSETSIAWTDYTFNPWWGCQRVSPGCEHCYAETLAHRLGMDLWGPGAGRRFFDDRHWAEPIKWWRRRVKGDPRHRVFCASMADVFEDLRTLDGQRERLWALIESTPELTWQLLTKRPENAARLTPTSWASEWPANVWALVTAEDQERADLRIPRLFKIPARVHGVSYEPALGPVDFRDFLVPGLDGEEHGRHPGLDWIIAGGESGPGARRFNVAWARSVVRDCKAAWVACFVKQVGANVIDRNDAGFEAENETWAEGPDAGRPTEPTAWPTPHGGVEDNIDGYRDDYQGAPVRVRLKDRMGADPAEWPGDLRVREFPA